MANKKDIFNKLDEALNWIMLYSNYIYDNQESFLTEFGKGVWERIIEISFSSNYIHFVYTISSGDQLKDSIKIKEFKTWMREVQLKIFCGGLK